ncbi:MAG: hypothetical protein ACLP1D_21320, partial [Xanthobacteraceae bacterium]
RDQRKAMRARPLRGDELFLIHGHSFRDAAGPRAEIAAPIPFVPESKLATRFFPELKRPSRCAADRCSNESRSPVIWAQISNPRPGD